VNTGVGVLGLVFLDAQEYERWMKSAYKTLESARRDRENGFYNWACFKSHQASDKALKALLWGLGGRGRAMPLYTYFSNWRRS